MVVYASTQFPENTHSVIARCLGVLGHNIYVITRRVGGVFSGPFAQVERKVVESLSGIYSSMREKIDLHAIIKCCCEHARPCASSTSIFL
ncbi:hypothetical protein MTR67_048970 [Solanum verrucosum]|uniref:Aldehyde oxidase/xanthine dehydrogenase first molybdopterin binding domain-containing protein n=1 Tax=Solanum verrucosum TaxID=315347 RepID=A0AAF0UZE1_SOLVR|nr:hypothetical protein MTR67_048970 [Solanum verrucosum]